MNMLRRIVIVLITFGLICGIGRAAEVGLDTNAPISAATGDIAAPPQVVADTGTAWVRVNFILGPWTSPGDATPRGSHNGTWFQTYDTIINGFTSRGVKVYGLIGGEAVKSAHPLNSDGYAADYAANFVAIVDHFKDRVRVFESFNEPNDWAGGTSAQVTPHYMAKFLEDIYRAVKIDNGHWGNPDWQVTLVSSPLFTHDLDNGASYMSSVYTAGINDLGWTALMNDYGTYPLDGIGIHLYVAQGETTPAPIIAKMNENLNATWGAVTAREGAQTPKKFWVSEFGWSSQHITEAQQAANLQTSFGVLLADSRVALATWFSLTDFPGGGWGLFRQGGLIEQNKKPAWQAFRDIAVGNPTPTPSPSPTPGPTLTPGPTHSPSPTPAPTLTPAPTPTPLPWNGALESAAHAAEFPAAATESAVIVMRNTGGNAWTGAGEANPVRLASLGFPEPNDFGWADFSNGGFFNSLTDATAYLGGSVAPNQLGAFSFSITSPPWPGAFVLGAQLRETATPGYFGPALHRYILVTRDDDNALANGGFEDGNLGGWSTFGEVDGAQTGPWFAGITPRSGNVFLGSAANFGQKNGSVWQRFVLAEPESLYGARVYVRTYREGGVAGDTACRLGLDPTGNTTPGAGTILWTPWTESEDDWTPLYQFARPDGTDITVFLQFRQQAPTWNITCFDDAILLPPAFQPEESWMLK